MQVQDVSRLFKILGDPTRLRLMRLMAECELSVMELADVTQLAQSRVSNHLKLLREEGLIQERRDGAWRHYRVDTDRLPETARPLWDAVEQAWQADNQLAADAARLQQVLARRDSTRGQFFETFAGEWDAIRSEMFGDSIARHVLRHFVPSDVVVADIGSGTGYTIELLGDRPAKIIAIDNSDAMLGVARRKVESLGLDNVEFRTGDAHEPPLKRGEADLVTFVMVLHHLDEPARAIASAAKGLKPGGQLIVVDFLQHQETWVRDVLHHRWLGFAREQLDEWLEKAGLVTQSWSVLPGRTWITPQGKKVSVPDGLALFADKQGRSK